MSSPKYIKQNHNCDITRVAIMREIQWGRLNIYRSKTIAVIWMCCFNIINTWTMLWLRFSHLFPFMNNGLLFSDIALQRRHNERDVVSNHQPHDCLLNCLFRRRSKKTSKLRVTGLCEGNWPGPGELPAQRASNAKKVSIWWRHHGWYHSTGKQVKQTQCGSFKSFILSQYFLSETSNIIVSDSIHDDVIKWRHFTRCFPFMWGIHQWPVNSLHKGQWRGTSMLCLIYVWKKNGWVANRDADDLIRCRAHYDVTVMCVAERYIPPAFIYPGKNHNDMALFP